MKYKEKHIAVRQAKRWAEEEHFDVMCKLPSEICRNIDWELVACDLGIKLDLPSFPHIAEHIQRLLDYMFEDEASDYSILEGQFQRGHIFESILAVQRWLAARRP